MGENWRFLNSLFLLSLIAERIIAYESTPPLWLTSDYFRAGNQYVINSYTDSSTTPQFTFLFSSALPGIPYLAYGLKNYRGDDYLGVQQWQIRRISLTQSSFHVAVQIFGSTKIWMMGVPYIAIDPTFPHKLNSFDNVPINYGAGNLVNVTRKNVDQILYYSNNINYTEQATGTNYTVFDEPLESNKILLFMMALNIWSTNQGSSTTWYPVTLAVDVQVTSSSTYNISLQLSYNVEISLLHFSMIIFNEDDVKSSNTYFIVAEKIDYPQQGGSYPLPEQFVDNFIMGLTDFSTIRGQAVLHYNWEFSDNATADGEFGVVIEESLPNRWPDVGIYALTRMGTMIFYIKTWRCPEGYPYFNLTSNFCQDCLSEEDCLCNPALAKRHLSQNSTCDCNSGYYDDTIAFVCQSCILASSNCLTCQLNQSYQSADATSSKVVCFSCGEGRELIDGKCQGFSVLEPEQEDWSVYVAISCTLFGLLVCLGCCWWFLLGAKRRNDEEEENEESKSKEKQKLIFEEGTVPVQTLETINSEGEQKHREQGEVIFEKPIKPQNPKKLNKQKKKKKNEEKEKEKDRKGKKRQSKSKGKNKNKPKSRQRSRQRSRSRSKGKSQKSNESNKSSNSNKSEKSGRSEKSNKSKGQKNNHLVIQDFEDFQ